MYTISLAVALATLMPKLMVGQDGVMTSQRASRDEPLRLDPERRFWREAPAAIADRDPYGAPLPSYRTEIRSRWTRGNLYLLFVCPYEELNLKPRPSRSRETFRLWDWDVAEVFLGLDPQNIGRYKEFEVSPRGEWVDLDVDLSRPHHEDGWIWNSGTEFKARIDAQKKIWYGAMRIPWAALQGQEPVAGKEIRANFYRSQGPSRRRVKVTWRPTMTATFHTPERFGTLRLEDEEANASEHSRKR